SLTGAPIWDLVEDDVREPLSNFLASWTEEKPVASRVKVALRRIGAANPWVECLVCAIAFEGRRALGVTTIDITQAVLAADSFACVLPSCMFGEKSLERCRTCLYGLPSAVPGDRSG